MVRLLRLAVPSGQDDYDVLGHGPGSINVWLYRWCSSAPATQ